jgi:DNA modification methylase
MADVDTQLLYCDDNLDRLRVMPDASVDLVYLDPPFFSNRTYEVIWGDEAEVRSFKDRWEGGIWHYVDWMRERLVELHRVLKPTGNLLLHCDQNASHYLKCAMDEIFGQGLFRNEIVWQRTGAKSLNTIRLATNHDVILSYGRSDTTTFVKAGAVIAYDPNNLPPKVAEKYSLRDPDGRRYQLDNLTNPNHDRPNLTYEFMGVTKVWRWTRDRMQAAFEAGLIVQPGPGRVPRFKRYLDEQAGMPLGDVWTDIPPVNSQARERLGYPTQKPEALMERLIGFASRPEDVVLDPFCGCGTTVAVAHRMGRRWIGIDISPTAMEVMRRRFYNQYGGWPSVQGMPDTIDKLKALDPFEFQNWVITQVGGEQSPRRSRDMGIDGYSYLERHPIQVKQSEHVGRKVIDEFQTAVRRAGHDEGHVFAFSFTRDAREEVARAKWAEQIRIKLFTISQLLAAEDKRPVELRPVTGKLLELPIPAPRPKSELPTAEELVASAEHAV